MKINFEKFSNLSKKTKIIICAVAGVLVLAGVVGGSIAIANAAKKNKQAKCEHIYGEGVVKVEATCEKAGMLVYTCGECDYNLTEEIPANGHVQTVIEAVPATCTAKGLTDGVQCVTCDKVLVAPTETPILGHKIESLKAVPATCLTAGKTEGSQCSRCESVLKEQTVIPAKGHTVVEMKGVEPTCTMIGKSNGSSCSSCGVVYSEQEIIPALGHSDANGDGVCDVCGDFNPLVYLAKFAVEGSCVETGVETGEKVLGNVYRIYRPTTDAPGYGYNAYGLTNSPPFIAAYIATDAENYDNPYYAVGCNPDNITIEGNFAYIVYEDYIDFYIGESTLTRGTKGTNMEEKTLVIDETTVLSIGGLGDADAIFRLTLV